MLPLPIVDRELRVSARRPRTYRIRVASASGAIALAGFILLFQHFAQGPFGTPIGVVLFTLFLGFSVVFTAVAGAFLTADSISEEKREGTLGLLFLTDLAGYDVVLGKLFVHSIQAAYALLAAFPIISTCFLLGGVTGSSFWKLMLLLVNSLGLSLSIGVFVSSLSRDALRSISLTLILLMAVFLGLPALDAWLGNGTGAAFNPRLSWVSPVLAVAGILDGTERYYWPCMAAVAGLSSTLLTVASLITPRTWQQGADRRHRAWPGARWRQVWSRKRRTSDPLAWLPGRDRSLTWMMTAALLLVIPPVLYLTWRQFQATPGTGMVTFTIGGTQGVFALFILLTKFWIATLAIRYLVDSRKTGAFELLLVTPARPTAIIHGHWRALLRRFAIPILLLTLVVGLGQAAQIRETLLQMQASYNTSNITVDLDFWFGFKLQMILQGVFSTLGNLTSALVLCWFGMWMALRSTRLNVALVQTIAFADFLPWIACHMVGIALLLGLQNGAGFVANGPGWTSHLFGVLNVIVGEGGPILLDFILIWFARKRVLAGFLPVVTGDPSAS